MRKKIILLAIAALSCLALACKNDSSDSTQSSDSTNTTTSNLYLFGTTATNPTFGLDDMGNVGDAREGADEFCSAEKPADLNCDEVRAMVSVSDTDRIADMPANYNFDQDIPVQASDGTVVGTTFEKLIFFVDGETDTGWQNVGGDGELSTLLGFADGVNLAWTGAGTGDFSTETARLGDDPVWNCSTWTTTKGTTDAAAHDIASANIGGENTSCNETTAGLLCLCIQR